MRCIATFNVSPLFYSTSLSLYLAPVYTRVECCPIAVRARLNINEKRRRREELDIEFRPITIADALIFPARIYFSLVVNGK